MRICLLASEYPACQPDDSGCETTATYIYRLAHGLNDLGHDVEVITLNSGADALLPSQGSVSPGASASMLASKPIQEDGPFVYIATYPDSLPDLNMLLMATPTLHNTLKTAFALWQVVLERHLDQPFDVIQIPEHLAIGILPALAKIGPVVVTLCTSPTQTIAAANMPAGPSGDELIVKLFERLCVVTADGLWSLNAASAESVVAELDLAPSTIQIIHNTVDQAVPNSDRKQLAKEMISLYQSAISKHAAHLTEFPAYKLYLKDPKELLSQALTLTIAFDKMIYDYLYQYSYRFRIAHWQRKAGKDPKRFARKALCRIIRPFAHMHPKLATFAEQPK